jgi:thiosulfate dehydrogenase
VAFSVVKDLDPRLPRGDAQRGAPLYAAACASCHGSMHSGKGRLSARIPKLPEDTIAEHADYSLRDQRLVFLEKIRHGGFYGYGGDMPPFSLEALSDCWQELWRRT